MSRAPRAEDAQGIYKLFAGTGQGVRDLGWRRVRDLTTNDAVRFELTKLGGQYLFAHTRQKVAKLGEPFWIKG